ncbi:MOXD1 homolog 1-like isoform X2 [Dreissena polymorpha]|uniref:Uncharacterized protein n=1 Tax=Dreissena polymorpha TaxID=45954 RepID=A0A9D4F9B6_DREPO|nr:MOXD1 homolog 1-like isoform X1 [Dreissena polymorpha]XP_052220104.1 MOXD1 homolog 1-like isoform X2 [Dreissena polymorpha]KAH3792360.1 hypothetical protein DPMN_145854 [Dreissena polymorpha]
MDTVTMFLRLAVFALVAKSLDAYSSYRDNIPNGYNVTHPCDSSMTWNGVGHENAMGGGARNPFGLDFKANNAVWDAAFCQKDSDGDGRTNGEELGDPNCVWMKGSVPQVKTGITHPGVCEPIGSTKCTGKNAFVNCQNTGKFVCPAIERTDTLKFEYRFPRTAVPTQETTYMCMNIQLPANSTYHLIASEPIIDNINIMHHIIVYGCPGLENAPGPLNKPAPCGAMKAQCTEMISLWAFGTHGSCFNENMGFKVGAGGLKYAIMEFHWNNPMLISTYTDSSGYAFYMTPNLRQYNAGVLMIGQNYLQIPPFATGHVESGSCTGSCSRQIMTSEIYLTEVTNHMHGLGKSMITELKRNGTRVQYLAKDDVFDYNAPVTHNYDVPVMIHPGDEMKTTCVYQSVKRNLTTFYGEGTQEEMCFSFLIYYPMESMSSRMCQSWKSMDFCEWALTPVKRGCNFTQLSDPNSKYTEINKMIAEKCTPFVCRQECFALRKELQKDPCFQGDTHDLYRRFALYNNQTKSEVTYFFAQLDSCDWEMWEEGRGHDNGDHGGKVSGVAASVATAFTSVLVPLLSALYL